MSDATDMQGRGTAIWVLSVKMGNLPALEYLEPGSLANATERRVWAAVELLYCAVCTYLPIDDYVIEGSSGRPPRTEKVDLLIEKIF